MNTATWLIPWWRSDIEFVTSLSAEECKSLIRQNIGSGVRSFFGSEGHMRLIGHLDNDNFWVMRNPGPAAFGNFYPVFYDHLEPDVGNTKISGRFRWKGNDLFVFYAILFGVWLFAFRPQLIFGPSAEFTSSGVTFAVIATLGLSFMAASSVIFYRRHTEEIAQSLRLLLSRN
jgi:hypothetical protein